MSLKLLYFKLYVLRAPLADSAVTCVYALLTCTTS